MDQSFYNIIILILAAFFSAVPVILVQQYLKTDKTKHYLILLSIISYIIVILFYIEIFEFRNAAIGHSIIKYISIIFVFIVGIFYYEQKITMKQYIGVILGLVAIYLLS
jgi:drug/metabolite transporter (DMT)-like permease